MIIANFWDNSRPAFYKEILKTVKNDDISILVINAGILRCGEFEITKPNVYSDMIDVNSYHYLMMHKVFLPKLLERTK